MPIVTVEYVLAANEAVPRGLARALADAIGAAVGATPGRTWVRLRALPRERYAESATDAADTPAPVFVTLLRRELPPPETLAAQAAAVTAAVARAMERPPEFVHVEFAPPMAGRMALGGTLVR